MSNIEKVIELEAMFEIVSGAGTKSFVIFAKL